MTGLYYEERSFANDIIYNLTFNQRKRVKLAEHHKRKKNYKVKNWIINKLHFRTKLVMEIQK